MALLVSMITTVLLAGVSNTATAAAADQPNAVSVPGDFGSEVGCPGDWQPDCAQVQLTRRGNDDVWSATLTLPAGSYCVQGRD